MGFHFHKLFGENFDEVLQINYQNNSINGTAILESEKCFFKILKEQNYFAELNGYFQSAEHIPIKKLIFSTKIDSFYILIYEYEKTIGKNKEFAKYPTFMKKTTYSNAYRFYCN